MPMAEVKMVMLKRILTGVNTEMQRVKLKLIRISGYF